MKYWIVKLFLAVLLSTSSQTIHICKANLDIPFQMIHGLIIVEAEYNEVKGNFIVDTGSSDVILDQQQNRASVIMKTLDKEYELGEVNIKNLRVGSIFHSTMHAFTADLENLESYTDMDIAGILGTNAFAPRSIEINYMDGVLIISEDEVKVETYENLHVVPFRMQDGVPVVEINIGSRKKVFILDTGATSHFIDSKVLGNDVSHVKTDGTRSVTTAFSASSSASVVVMKGLQIGDKQFEKQVMLSMPFDHLNDAASQKISGLISLNKLSPRVILDLKRMVILFE